MSGNLAFQSAGVYSSLTSFVRGVIARLTLHRRPAKLFLDTLHCDVINQRVPNWSVFHTGQELICSSVSLSVRGPYEQGSARRARSMP